MPAMLTLKSVGCRCMHPCKQMHTDRPSLWLLPQAIDAGTGLLYLHSRNIVHRDGALLQAACFVVLLLRTYLSC